MVFCLLSQFEHAHFNDLYTGGNSFWKLPANASPAEKRERAITALVSVLPQEKVRDQIGNDEVTVLHKGDLAERWRRS